MRLHVFENVLAAHGNVAGFGRDLADAFRAEGHEVVLSPVGGPAQEGHVVAALADGQADAIITFTGNGTDPNPDPAANLFNRTRARLVDLYLDPMALYIDALAQPIYRRLLGCSSPDGLSALAALLPPDQRLRLLPHAADPIEALPWERRDIPILLAGNCPELPATVAERWLGYPAEVRAILAAGEAAIVGGRAALCDTVRDLLAQSGRPARLSDFRSYCLEIDRMMRARLRLMAGAGLARLPVTVAGAGWDWMLPGRATLLGPLPATEVAELTRRARLCINLVTPYHGAHERVLRALAAAARPLSTPSSWYETALPAGLVAFAPAEGLADTAAGLAKSGDPGPAGAAAVAAGHTWRHRAREIIGWLEAGDG